MIFNKSLSDPSLVRMYEDGSRYLPSCVGNINGKDTADIKQKTVVGRYDFERGYDDASCNHWDGLREYS